MTSLRALAFGDLAAEIWGVGWGIEPGAAAYLAVHSAASSSVVEANVTLDDDTWRVEAEGISLVLRASTPPGRGAAADRLQTLEQLCEVSGEMRASGEQLPLHCLGWRSSLEGDVDLGSIESFRFLAGWIGTENGFSLTALRPRKARGHESDLIAAAVFDAPPPPPVVDPRLSTTYAASGLPARAGLELWFQEPDESDPEPDAAPQYPRRAAGEAVASGLEWSQSGFQLSASLLRWHSRGQDGPGVYVLGQRE